MDIREAQVIADIASLADGGCSSCIDGLRDHLQEAFPQFRWDFIDFDFTQEDRSLWGRRILVSEVGAAPSA